MVKIRLFYSNHRKRRIYIRSSSLHSSFAFMINILTFLCQCFITSFTSLISHLYQFVYIKKNYEGANTFRKITSLYVYLFCFHNGLEIGMVQIRLFLYNHKRTKVYKQVSFVICNLFYQYHLCASFKKKKISHWHTFKTML